MWLDERVLCFIHFVNSLSENQGVFKVFALLLLFAVVISSDQSSYTSSCNVAAFAMLFHVVSLCCCQSERIALAELTNEISKVKQDVHLNWIYARTFTSADVFNPKTNE